MVTTQAHEAGVITRAEATSERRPKPAGEVQEKEIKGKKFKLGSSLG